MSKRSRSSTKQSVKSMRKRNKSASARLTGQSRKLKSAKLAAARVVANAATAGFLGIEKKFLDTARDVSAITAATDLSGGSQDPSGTGCTGCLSCPAQGDTEQSRDGKRIVIDGLILKGFVINPATSDASPATDTQVAAKVFVAVVLDTQTNGATIASEQVFKSLGASLPFNACPTKNLLFGNRYRILKSQVFDLTPIGTVQTGTTYVYNSIRRDFDWFIPFKGGLPVNLNAGTTANVANVIDNSLHVVAFATTTLCTMGYNARIRFQG